MYEAKAKALISCAVTAQLICAFVFAYAKGRFSHDAAQFIIYWTDIAFSRHGHDLYYMQDYDKTITYFMAQLSPFEKLLFRLVTSWTDPI